MVREQEVKIHMSDNHFADVDVESMGYGGLGGMAVENLHKAKAKTTAAGVLVKLDCGTCGAPNVMTIDWPEAIIISAGAIPRGWTLDRGHVRPEIGCGQCKRLVTPAVTPDEAQRWVKAGIAARFVNPQQAQQIVQQATRR